MASFQANVDWKSKRKRENKYYRSVPLGSYPTRNRKFQRNSKKSQKNFRKTNMASFPAKIGWTRLRKREKKNYRSVLV